METADPIIGFVYLLECPEAGMELSGPKPEVPR
jgi:hypothetical protein